MHGTNININTNTDYLCTFPKIATVISCFPQHNSMIGLHARDLYVCDVGVWNISGSYSDCVENSFFWERYYSK
jgi:hypothetical protein